MGLKWTYILSGHFMGYYYEQSTQIKRMLRTRIVLGVTDN
jgi:hypothetical protein